MKSVKELIDDRSSDLSSRPTFSGLDVVTGGKYFVTAPSGKLVWVTTFFMLTRSNIESHFWKISRKVIQPLVSPQAVQKYFPVADAETTQLLYDILHNPEVTFTYRTRSELLNKLP